VNLAQRIKALIFGVTGARIPVTIRAWDGSRSDAETPSDLPILDIREAMALRRILWRPNELGIAQAYILGEIDVEGSLADAFPAVWDSVSREGGKPRVSLAAAWEGLRLTTRYRALGPPPPAPEAQASLTGQVNGRVRDRDAIGFHYDLSNDFYRLILDERMVYSCGYWCDESPEYGLAEAQRDKLDLICRKLGLRPGMRLLDVGCGWGALAIHAAEHYGAHVVAVTLSRQQFEFARARAEAVGVSDRVEFRLQDYRDIEDEPFEAVSTVEMGEHVGEANYPRFAARLRELLIPGGRLLVQQMSRGATAPGGGAFIESYIAPDMHMRPVGQTVELLEATGLEVHEVQSLREHYVLTVRHWLSTLEERWDEAVDLVGEVTARVWRLYLVGGALAFERNRMGVHQILLVVPDADGRSRMSNTPVWAVSDNRATDREGC